jgi:peptidoglycan/xylan/chitin deacetylase (PgdA/CDA1 family)
MGLEHGDGFRNDAADLESAFLAHFDVRIAEFSACCTRQMLFIKKSPNSHGFVNPRDIEQMWRHQFDWVYREYDYAVFPITIHPDVSGRPHVLMSWNGCIST